MIVMKRIQLISTKVAKFLHQVVNILVINSTTFGER